jgi:hypothetical protein
LRKSRERGISESRISKSRIFHAGKYLIFRRSRARGISENRISHAGDI